MSEIIDFLIRTKPESITYNFGATNPFGCFCSTTTQPISNTSNTLLTYNTTVANYGTIVLSGTTPTANISLPNTGKYRVLTRVELLKSTGGANNGNVYVWFALNGTPVPNSSTNKIVTNTEEDALTVETIITTTTTGMLLSVVARATQPNTVAHAEASNGTIPTNTPSIITNVQFLG